MLETAIAPLWIKVHFGRTVKASSYLPPRLFREWLEAGAVFVDTNTLYGGERHTTAAHLQVAARHGFQPARILADDELELPGTVLCATHLTGHRIMGLGGAIKNIGMGLATATEKMWAHNAKGPGGALYTKGPKIEQARRMGMIARRVERRNRLMHVVIADNLTAECDCQGTTKDSKVLWRGLWWAIGKTALEADDLAWQQFGPILRPHIDEVAWVLQREGYLRG